MSDTGDEAVGDEAVGDGQDAIHGPTKANAQAWMLARTVALPGCTGTRIGSRWVMANAHCLSKVGDRVNFYTTGPNWDPAQFAFVTSVFLPPGLVASAGNISSNNLYDANGIYADLEILQLDRDISVGAAATMAWSYPGAGFTGYDVGSMGGTFQPAQPLLSVLNITTTDDDSAGFFRNASYEVDKGDSGGPFYYGGRVQGTLYGSGWDGSEWHTSTRMHLDWILQTIGYRYSGNPPIANVGLNGTASPAFMATERACQYACEQKGDCKGYNYWPVNKSCNLYSVITGTLSAPGAHYSLLAGNAQSKVGDPTGYRRSDGYSAVLHRGLDGHVHEIYQGGGSNWTWGDIFSVATPEVAGTQLPAVSGRVSSYVRSDGVNSVLYRTTGNHIFELHSAPSGWKYRDFNGPGSLPAAAGAPAAITTWDKKSIMFWRAPNNQIFKVSPPASGLAGTWVAQAIAANAVGDPAVYVRSDRVVSVVYRATDSHIHELFSQDGGLTFNEGDLSGNNTFAAGNPSGFQRSDGVNSVVYRGVDGNVVELVLGANGWTANNVRLVANNWLAPLAVGDPMAYVRADGVNAIVYRGGGAGGGQDIIELALPPGGSWQAGNLSSWAPNWTGAAKTDPVGYVRQDGVTAVVFTDATNRVRELTQTGPGWEGWTLSANAGETP
jgi:hypothetical protein